jgi:hypothetical protein
MSSNLILKGMLFDFLFQVSAATLPVKAQPVINEMVNVSVGAKGELNIAPSKTSSATDFDFFMGSWDLTNRKLKSRLTNCTDWLEFNATQHVEKILRGLGNHDNYCTTINGAAFEGMTLRLFDPKTRLWSIYWADSNAGKLDVPVLGSFEGNIGRFYTRDVWQGKPVIMLFKWDKTDPANPKWSQALSTDNGKTWEWNWYMNFKRANSEPKDAELNENQNIKVLELRNYILKPGKRDAFINYFEQHFITPQNILGGFVLGQFRVKDADNRFLWFRGFSDMASRSVYLPEFYRKSLVWQKYKAGANELIDDNDDVHLLRPVNDISSSSQQNSGINTNAFAKHKGIVVVEYYTANEGGLDTLISFYQSKYKPYLQAKGINNSTLWVSELTPNDFPSLPVIQDKNLLVAITFYKDGAEYQSKQKTIGTDAPPLKTNLTKLIKGKQTMVIYPTGKSFGEITE